MQVALDKLDLAPQTRAAIDEEVVKDYAALLAELCGVTFPTAKKFL